MFEKIKFVVKYKDIKNYLINDLEYPDFDAIETIKDLRQMQKPVLKVFVNWFPKRYIMPEIESEGIKFCDLINDAEMNYINAFITINWLMEEPEYALHAIYSYKKDFVETNTMRTNPNPPADETDIADFIVEE